MYFEREPGMNKWKKEIQRDGGRDREINKDLINGWYLKAVWIKSSQVKFVEKY